MFTHLREVIASGVTDLTSRGGGATAALANLRQLLLCVTDGRAQRVKQRVIEN